MMEIAQDLIKLGWILVQAGVIILILVLVITVSITVVIGTVKSMFKGKRQSRDSERIREQFETVLGELRQEMEKTKLRSPGSEFGTYKFERKQD